MYPSDLFAHDSTPSLTIDVGMPRQNHDATLYNFGKRATVGYAALQNRTDHHPLYCLFFRCNSLRGLSNLSLSPSVCLCVGFCAKMDALLNCSCAAALIAFAAAFARVREMRGEFLHLASLLLSVPLPFQIRKLHNFREQSVANVERGPLSKRAIPQKSWWELSRNLANRANP